MPTSVQPANLSSLIVEYTQNVLSVMLGVEVSPLPHSFLADPHGPAAEVIALVGFVGSWAGVGSLSCTAETARKIGQKMLLAEFDQANEEVLDAIGEIANMIVGNLKDALEPTLGPLGLGTPTVLQGDPVRARSLNGEAWTTVSFSCMDGVLDVKVSISQCAISRVAHTNHRKQ